MHYFDTQARGCKATQGFEEVNEKDTVAYYML
jgi:hypothetical protein